MKFGGQPTPWSDEQIDGLRCRTVAQTLIEEIGADGPESAEDAAKRAVTVIQRQRDHIAALEAEKAEREAQEPVAYVTDEPSPNPEPIAWLAGKRAGMKLYSAPPVPHVDPDWLANVIRTVDGNHKMGAGALAEKIAEAINGRSVK